MRKVLQRLRGEDGGAVAPTVALSLFALIACGGIAFDYARLVSMDTELQNAADQAALAAASQLDGESGAIARAEAAATNLITNQTRFANDSGGVNVGNLSFIFYVSYNQANDSFGPETTNPALAKVVRVTVGGRQAFYALTPVVGALQSGPVTAEAVAGLGTAVCKVPPLMICNPHVAVDPEFTQDYSGKGFLLVGRNNNTDTYGPGNFGFLDTGYDTTGGTSTLRRALGQSNFNANCMAGDQVTTEPGASSPALDAVNTRFDIYSSNVQMNSVCGSGQCPPSENVRKDLMRDAPSGSGSGSGPIKSFCKPVNDPNPDNHGGGPKGWKLMPSGRYEPSSNAALSAAQRAALNPMGHPRDICHAVSESGVCSGDRVGDGVWDRAAYFQSNYGAGFSWQTASGLGSNVSRYQTYLWELSNQTNATPAGINRTYNITGPGGGTLHGRPICQTSGAVWPTGDIDRRRLTVAVVNCSGSNSAHGKKTLEVTRWIDVFLVEPSWSRPGRTTANDLYVEIIGPSTITGEGGQAYQVERSVPFLIR